MQQEATPRAVGLLYDPDVLEHQPPPGHPERPLRVQGIVELLKRTGLWDALTHLPSQPATRAQMERVHLPEYLDFVESIARRGGGRLDESDTVASAGTWRAVTAAAGCAAGAVDAVMAGTTQSAFALVRPPGHHAPSDRAMGFCVINHAAVAAAHASAAYGLSRVLLVDFDVHHGNGTQEIFYANPHVLYFSTHQSPAYPFTGMVEETGAGEGTGFTVNVPLPALVDDAGFGRVFDDILGPLAARFQPELIIASAGYDAHWRNRAYVQGIKEQMTVAGLASLAARLQTLADTHCPGRLVGILEGGYDLEALALGVCATLRAWQGHEPLQDPIGLAPDFAAPPDITGLLAHVRRTHGL